MPNVLILNSSIADFCPSLVISYSYAITSNLLRRNPVNITYISSNCVHKFRPSLAIHVSTRLAYSQNDHLMSHCHPIQNLNCASEETYCMPPSISGWTQRLGSSVRTKTKKTAVAVITVFVLSATHHSVEVTMTPFFHLCRLIYNGSIFQCADSAQVLHCLTDYIV